MLKQETAVYPTWYDFKCELQRRSGLVILNQAWLQIKPKAPLPWSEHHLQESLRLMAGIVS